MQEVTVKVNEMNFRVTFFGEKKAEVLCLETCNYIAPDGHLWKRVMEKAKDLVSV